MKEVEDDLVRLFGIATAGAVGMILALIVVRLAEVVRGFLIEIGYLEEDPREQLQ